jgi:phosphoenolpyruvate carboxykinase (GTP)
LHIGAKVSTADPVPVVHGDWQSLPEIVRKWTATQIRLCHPDGLHIMDGSEEEDAKLKQDLVRKGVLIPLSKYDNCFLARTDPLDVARVESRTVISTPTKIETIPDTAEGVQGQLGCWMSPEDLDDRVHTLFPGSMKGNLVFPSFPSFSKKNLNS